MAAYKENGTWTAYFRYKDWKNDIKIKKKL